MALLALAACRGEPSPTIQGPPNPTSAPASTLAGCVVEQGAAGRAPSPTADYRNVMAGTLLAGSVTTPNHPPFESVQAGAASGFDIQLIGEVARRLGLRIEIQGETPASLLSEVAAGRTDVAISAISITAARRAQVDFSDPYFTSDLGLSVGVDRAREFSGLASLAGQVIGVAAGSYGEACARGPVLAQAKGASVRTYTDVSAAFTDLAVGRIGAVLTDLPSSDRFDQAVPGVQMVRILRTQDQYAIAVAKNNPGLLQALNRVLADIHQDGTYALIFQNWFQVPPPSL